LEARARSSADGAIQVFYDDGTGWREELSGRATVSASPEAITYRLPFPPGTYRALRLDPLDRSGQVVIESLRVVAPSGRNLRDIPLEGFKPVQQVESSAVREGALHIAISGGSDDPQLETVFASPLAVTASWIDY